MPAKSKKQKVAMLIALHNPDKLYKRNKSLLSMSKAELEEFVGKKKK